MQENYRNEVLYYTFPKFDELGFVKHAFSSREGGVSTGIYSSMNLGINTDDLRENILENYRLFTEAIGVDMNKVVLGQLTHEANVRVVTAEDAGCGLLRDFTYSNIDALVTNVPGLVLTCTYADCVPVFFADPVNKAVGIAHSGWRGTAAEISDHVVECMKATYGTKPRDLICGIGPSIGCCCYEVDRETCQEFVEMDYLDEAWCFEKDNGKFDLDLQRIIFGTLCYAGVDPDNIYISGICTSCNSDVLFSHRASHGKRGCMAGMISVKEEGV